MRDLYILLILITVSLSACNKDGAKAPQLSERFTLLTTGQWRLVANMQGSDDVYSRLPACMKDNYLVFKKDGILEHNEGATMCPGTVTQVSNGDWRFEKNETELWMDGGPWTIVELTATSLNLKSFSISASAETTMSFVKQ